MISDKCHRTHQKKVKSLIHEGEIELIQRETDDFFEL